MLDPKTIFAEALAVPAWLQTRKGDDISVACIGPYAGPLGGLALRYGDTKSVTFVGSTPPVTKDKRIAILDKPEDIEPQDVMSVAMVGDPIPVIHVIKPKLKLGGALVVALDSFQRGPKTKELLKKYFSHVLPYRETLEHTALFFLCTDYQVTRPVRPWPQNLQRLSPPYLQTLFVFPKDEYLELQGEAA